MNKQILAVLTLAMLASCSNKAKTSIGLTTSAPDEFQVQTVKPLEMPPHYNLPEPDAVSIQAEN